MKLTRTNKIGPMWLALLSALGLFSACSKPLDPKNEDAHGTAAEEVVKGPHRGRLLSEGPFAIELAIFESGVPPEFHAWATLDGKPVPPGQVQLSVELERLGGKVDRFAFAPKDGYLRGDGVVREPHSFIVKIAAQHAGKSYAWSYDSFEGRTRIAADIAASAGVVTEVAGPTDLLQTLTLYGRIAPDPTRQREVSARYPGMIRAVHKKVGDRVSEGESLAEIESNESLKSYSVKAPINGTIVARDANPGEQSGTRALFSIVDASSVVAELSVFPRDRAKVRRGAPVVVGLADSDTAVTGKIDRIDAQTGNNQSVTARVIVANANGDFLLGSFVTGKAVVSKRAIPLAVRTGALQPFRDFTVVFEQIGDQYEVRMLELGERQGEWAEVLGGLEPGARYVTDNSYLIKADIDKSGASHDH